MCELESLDGTSEQHALAVYREHRKGGKDHGAAYAAALREFQRLAPEITAYDAMGALKDALWREPELGFVDSAAIA